VGGGGGGGGGESIVTATGEDPSKSPSFSSLSSQSDSVKKRREMFALAAEARLTKRPRVEEVQKHCLKVADKDMERKRTLAGGKAAAGTSTMHDHTPTYQHDVVEIIDDDDDDNVGPWRSVQELSELGGLPYNVIETMLRNNNDDVGLVRQLLLSKILGT
jgi:hypothetical protein